METNNKQYLQNGNFYFEKKIVKGEIALVLNPINHFV